MTISSLESFKEVAGGKGVVETVLISNFAPDSTTENGNLSGHSPAGFTDPFTRLHNEFAEKGTPLEVGLSEGQVAIGIPGDMGKDDINAITKLIADIAEGKFTVTPADLESLDEAIQGATKSQFEIPSPSAG